MGPATERSISSLGFSGDNIHGAHCGNGQQLADYIVGHYTSTKKLLFLVGEIHRDAIPKTLRAAGISVDELVVYDTQVVESFGDDFARALEQCGGGAGAGGSDGNEAEGEIGVEAPGQQEKAAVVAGPRWVVVFSPTGADTAMEVLGYKRQGIGIGISGSSTTTGAPDSPASPVTTTTTYVATIGPTTASHLRGLGVEPDVVAAAPSPKGLWAAMARFPAAPTDGAECSGPP